jgi:hypothetical protein
MEKDFSQTLRVAITDDIIEEWLDSFDPSVRTHVADFSINTLRKYDYNYDEISDKADRHFAELLSKHLIAFLKVRKYN